LPFFLALDTPAQLPKRSGKGRGRASGYSPEPSVTLHAIMYQGFTPIAYQEFTAIVYHRFTPIVYQ
jgi:hypothetical protein